MFLFGPIMSLPVTSQLASYVYRYGANISSVCDNPNGWYLSLSNVPSSDITCMWNGNWSYAS